MILKLKGATGKPVVVGIGEDFILTIPAPEMMAHTINTQIETPAGRVAVQETIAEVTSAIEAGGRV